MYAVAVVSRYLNNPGRDHWLAVKRILRYIKGTIDYGIIYDGSRDRKLIGFTDADYAGDPDTRRSTSGYIFTICGGPVSWMSQRQKIVAMSTTEVEYIAASDATKEVIWLRHLLESVGAVSNDPTMMKVDNQGAIKLIKNPEFHKRTKHIDIRFHFIREKYDEGQIEVSYVPSSDQLADIMTKALSKELFLKLRSLLQIEDLEKFSTGGSVEKS